VRILMLSDQYAPSVFDGAGAYIGEIAPALAERGHDVHVLHCHRGISRDVDETIDGVVVHRRRTLRSPWGPVLRKNRIMASLEWHLTVFLRGPHYPRDRFFGRLNLAASAYLAYRSLHEEFDVIEVTETGAMALVLSLRPRPPLVMQLHAPPVIDHLIMGELRWRDRLAGAMDRVAITRADIRTSPSQMLIDVIRSEGLVPDLDAVVVPLAYSPRPEPGLLAGEAPPVVLGVGRIEPSKRWAFLVEAAGLLVGDVPGLQVVIAGGIQPGPAGSEHARELLTRAEALSVDLRLLGAVDHAAMTDIYEGARVLAITSVFENFSMCGVEALARGRPIVCNDRLGYGADLQASGAAIAYPLDDAAACARALHALLGDPALATTMGQRGRRWVESVLDPRRVARIRESIYHGVASPMARLERAELISA
jgi:glycogen synthase